MGSVVPPGRPPKAHAGPPYRRWSHAPVITICLSIPAATLSEVSSTEHGQGKCLSETCVVFECCLASAMMHKRSASALQRYMCCSCRHEADCRLRITAGPRETAGEPALTQRPDTGLCNVYEEECSATLSSLKQHQHRATLYVPYVPRVICYILKVIQGRRLDVSALCTGAPAAARTGQPRAGRRCAPGVLPPAGAREESGPGS